VLTGRSGYGVHDWFETVTERTMPLHEADAVLMRKDPPFDNEQDLSQVLSFARA